MKELTIEQKAQRYDEAIEIAKEINNEQRAQPFNIMTKIFPELKESEDERMRKAIRYAIEQSTHTDGILINNISREEALAWFEKQSEQKSIDNVEPKFHKGDWIICCDCEPVQIISIKTNTYEMSNGDIRPFYMIDNNDNIRLWTIQDAKDGDVLAAEAIEEYYQYPFVAICKERGLDFFNSYCFIGFNGEFYEADTGHSIEKIHPATEEQRDLLFQKMKEAGYEWDAEKKKLKKIEQNPAWSEEDNQYLYGLIGLIEQSKAEIPITLKGKAADNCIDWLKSLRPQNNITDKELTQAKKDAYNDALDKIEYHRGEPTFDDGWSAAIWYLKKRSAMPQKQWKLSEEQMKDLDNVILK